MIFNNNLPVLGCSDVDGVSLPLSVVEHCFVKTELNNLAFSVKLVTNLFSLKIGWNTE